MDAPAICLISRFRVAAQRFTHDRSIPPGITAQLAAFFILTGLVCIPLAAQTASLTNASTITLGSGFNAPKGLAVDANGNIFVADTGNNAVKEILAASGYTRTNDLASGSFNAPQGLAFDSYGNLFVADSGSSTVKVLSGVSGYSTVSTLVQSSAFSGYVPTGVAIDKNGNLWVSGTTNTAVGFFEFLGLSGYATNAIALGASSSDPSPGIAVDSNDNVYVGLASGVMEVPAPNHNSAIVFGGINTASGLAIDKAGNVLIADPGNNAVEKALASTGFASIPPVGSGFNQPHGVAVDALGNVFVADTGNNAVKEVPAGSASLNFGTVSVGTAVTATYEFVFASGGTIAAPAVLTQGAANQDFADAGTGTCTTNGTGHVYVAEETCTVTVTFSPKHPGTRYGAVQLLNSSGAPIVTALVYGTGVGPQIAFSPGTQSTVGAGFSAPQGVAVDGNGNVLVGDTGNNAVKEISASTVRTLGSGFSAPQGVALDGAGDVFLADTGNNAVKEMLAANGVIPASPTIKTLGSGFNAPTGVTVDESGNVIVNDAGNGVVKEILAAGDYTTVNTLGGSFSYPVLQATDVNGNVFTADTANNRVRKIDHADPPQLIFDPALVGSTSVDSPQTVTVSNIGNADLTFPVPSTGDNASVSSGFALGNSSTCPVLSSSSGSNGTLGAGTSCTYLVSFSPSASGTYNGSLVLTDNNLNANAAQTILLSGATQSAQSIAFTPPSKVTFGVPPVTLSATSTSGLTVAFSVLSGPGSITGNVLTVTGAGTIVIAADQAGNTTYAAAAEVQQSIVSSPATPTITWAEPSAITYGTPLSTTQLNATLSVAGSCTYSPATGTVLGAGTQTLTAICTATDSTDFTTVSKSVSLIVNQATPTITWVTPFAITYGTSLSATQLNAALSVAGSCTYSPAAGTVLSAGMQTLTAACTPANSSNYKTPAPASITVLVNRAPLTVTASSAAVSFGAAIPAITANYAGFVNGDAASVLAPLPSCTTSYTTSSPAGVYPTMCSGAAALNYSIGYVDGSIAVGLASQTLTFTKPATPVVFGTPASMLSASASSGLPVSFSTNGSCALGGNSLIYTSAGRCTVTASQAGNTQYAPATAISYTVTVSQSIPTITWPTPNPISYGTALSAIQLNATANVAGTITYTATLSGGSAAAVHDGSILATGSYTLTATLTPTDATDFTGATSSVPFTVNPATAAISSLSPAHIGAGGSAFTLTVTGTNFNSNSAVYWGSAPLSTTYVSPTQLTAAVGAAQIASQGIANVSVLSSDGSFSNALAFAIDTAGTSAPAFASTTATVTAGTTATYTFVRSPTTSIVSVSCLNLPAGASCSYSSTTNAVTISTSSSTPIGSYQVTVLFTESATTTTAAILFPFFLLPLFFVRKGLKSRKMWFAASLGLILLAGSFVSIGCGGNTTKSTTQTSASQTVTLIVK